MAFAGAGAGAGVVAAGASAFLSTVAPDFDLMNSTTCPTFLSRAATSSGISRSNSSSNSMIISVMSSSSPPRSLKEVVGVTFSFGTLSCSLTIAMTRASMPAADALSLAPCSSLPRLLMMILSFLTLIERSLWRIL